MKLDHELEGSCFYTGGVGRQDSNLHVLGNGLETDFISFSMTSN